MEVLGIVLSNFSVLQTLGVDIMAKEKEVGKGDFGSGLQMSIKMFTSKSKRKVREASRMFS